MLTGRSMPKGLTTAFQAVLIAFLADGGVTIAVAEEWCFPHCDYVHYYGPYDFTYNKPSLYGYPQQCGPQGDCAPHLAYMTGVPRRIPAGRVTVRFPRFMAPPQQ
jgi:hypothetical protein